MGGEVRREGARAAKQLMRTNKQDFGFQIILILVFAPICRTTSSISG